VVCIIVNDGRFLAMSIRKSITALSAAFILNMISSATAGGIEIPTSPFSGAYLGIGVGPGLISVFGHFEDRTATGILVQVIDSPLAKFGFVANVHLGYGHVFNRLYLGGQLFGEWWTPSVGFTSTSFSLLDTTTNVFRNKLHIRPVYGVLIRPGAQITPNSLIYLDLGTAFQNLRIKDTFDFATSGIFGTAKVHRSGQVGFRAGIGVSVAPRKHFSIGLEYFYTYYTPRVTLFFPPLFITDSHRRISTHNLILNLELLNL
jgi:opacity protein-like surface antigen